jgi:hypothetical protein
MPIVTMLLLDFFNNKVTDRKEIEALTRVPIIGEVIYKPDIENKIIHAKSRSRLAEQFRTDRHKHSICAGELLFQGDLDHIFYEWRGKSFIALNLAGALSSGESRVLLGRDGSKKTKACKIP